MHRDLPTSVSRESKTSVPEVTNEVLTVYTATVSCRYDIWINVLPKDLIVVERVPTFSFFAFSRIVWTSSLSRSTNSCSFHVPDKVSEQLFVVRCALIFVRWWPCLPCRCSSQDQIRQARCPLILHVRFVVHGITITRWWLITTRKGCWLRDWICRAGVENVWYVGLSGVVIHHFMTIILHLV